MLVLLIPNSRSRAIFSQVMTFNAVAKMRLIVVRPPLIIASNERRWHATGGGAPNVSLPVGATSGGIMEITHQPV